MVHHLFCFQCQHSTRSCMVAWIYTSSESDDERFSIGVLLAWFSSLQLSSLLDWAGYCWRRVLCWTGRSPLWTHPTLLSVIRRPSHFRLSLRLRSYQSPITTLSLPPSLIYGISINHSSFFVFKRLFRLLRIIRLHTIRPLLLPGIIGLHTVSWFISIITIQFSRRPNVQY